MATRGNVEEIFDSVQGEGPLVGVRQLFLRMGGCNLDCAYCDTPQARHPSATCRIEVVPATGRYEYMPNTLSEEDVFGVLAKLRVSGHHSVAVTGGEPLMQADFLLGLLPMLRREGLKVYLDTNATYPEALAQLAGEVDYVAADIKLSSCTGQESRFDVNREFLAACRGPELFVKFVITEEVDTDELVDGLTVVADSGAEAIVVIQPAVGRRGEVSVGPGVLMDLQRRALEVYRDVRVIPRVHQLLRLS